MNDPLRDLASTIVEAYRKKEKEFSVPLDVEGDEIAILLDTVADVLAQEQADGRLVIPGTSKR